ncbi:MAG: hypothetical protein V1843_00190, partial [bacterium]
MLHAWDWAIADRWAPEWSFGYATLTVYPDPHSETNSVDGYCNHFVSAGTDWATLRGAAGNDFIDNSANILASQIYSHTDTDKWKDLERGIFLFLTSSLGAGNIIDGKFSIYGASKADNLSITPNLNIYVSAPASNTTLAGGDFDSLGAIALCDTAITYAGFSTAGYNDFVLNADGLTNINKTSVSKFGTRNVNYDVSGSTPVWSSNTYSFHNCFGADQAGTSNDPKLVVNYEYPKIIIDAGSYDITGQSAGLLK